MSALAVAVAVFLLVFLLFLLASSIFGAEERRRREQVSRRLEALSMAARRGGDDNDRLDLLRPELLGSLPLMDRILHRIELFGRLRTFCNMESGEKGCNYRVAGGLGSRRTAERGEHGVPKLTKTFVDGLEPPERGELKWWDEGKGSVTGFGVRVRATGRTTWIVQYRTTRGRTRRLTIGTVGRMTPEQARTEARQALAAVDRGEDPVVERKKARGAASVRELV
jgi:hypothetical protein